MNSMASRFFQYFNHHMVVFMDLLAHNDEPSVNLNVSKEKCILMMSIKDFRAIYRFYS